MPDASIALLPELIAALPPGVRTICERVLVVERVQGYTVPPPAMHAWIEQRFGNVEQVREQTIVKVTNRLTLEATLFNSLRGRRLPAEHESNAEPPDVALERIIQAHTSHHDMFANPLAETTADVFGRIRGSSCTSASNIAKYDGWHGLVIFDEPHPLRFERDQLHDYFNVALRWLQTAHAHDPTACYPFIGWNCLWKAGASITHGHMQVSLATGMPYAQVERWRRAAADYRSAYQHSLSDDLWRVYTALGLVCYDEDGVRGYVTLTPFKERELVLMSDRAARLAPLWDATYAMLRALIDNQGVRSFNLAVYLPPWCPTPEAWYDLPLCVRIVDRGDPLSRMVSIGTMELFGSSVVSVDPFAVAAALRNLRPSGSEP